MNLRWYARRLAGMSPAEAAGRARDELTRRGWRSRQVTDPGADPTDVPIAGAAFAARLPVAGDEVPEDARLRLKEAAEGLLGGHWAVFACERDDMAPAPDWFLDPDTGRRAPDRTYCFAVDHRDPAVVGNVKCVWELSRHQHLSVLAAAYHLSGDERYAEAVATQLRSWWAANPFLSGVHWTSGIELGLRLLSWVWIRRMLDGWTGAAPLFEANRTFLQQLHHHQEWLARLPSHGSSANNHVVAEAAGQFAASCAFPWFPESSAWREAAATTLRRELVRQTFAGGLHRELATEYHGFVLELGLAAALEGELAGHPLGGEVWAALQRMTDALAAVVDVRLRPPRQGDADDGHGLLLDGPGYDRWASLLATGAALFGPASWWPPRQGGDARTALWTRLAARPISGGARPARRPSLFADAGMALLRDTDGRPDELWCRADHGPHGYLSIAAHAHADALAIELRVGGVDVLADPGTYCYGAHPAWRAYFRSTLAHNTLEVGGADQSLAAGTHLWVRKAKAELEGAAGLDDGPVAEWRAVHDGYRRLRPPVVHRRTVRLDRRARQLVVEDRLDGDAHDCRLAFHLGPDVGCALEGDRAVLRWWDGRGRRRATLTLPDELVWRSLRGESDPPAGWYSPAFGVRVPAVALLGSGRVGPGQTLTTVFQLDPGGDAMRISVYGLGYVGAVSAACLAADGHTVVGVDTNQVKVDLLDQGLPPVVEAGLGQLIEEGVRAGRLRATTDCDAAVGASDIGLVCVGTPSKGNGSLDLTNLRRVAGDIGQAIRRTRSPITVVVRSTVLPGTTRDVVLPELERTAGRPVPVAVYPEFLREGTAIRDHREPPKVVVGAVDEAVRGLVTSLAVRPGAPLVQTDLELAEMAKYVDNSWHALKVTFANEIGSLAKAHGLDGQRVMDILCTDTKLNLSPVYLRPGFAFGGSCLPKDVRALRYQGRGLDLDLPLLDAILSSNAQQLDRAFHLVTDAGARQVGVLGLAFKAGTDDLRESPMVEVVERLIGKGYDVRIYDANVNLAKLVGANRSYILDQIPHISDLMVASIDEVVDHARTLVIGNDDPAFRAVAERPRSGQRIVDLVHVVDRRSDGDGYDGIGW